VPTHRSAEAFARGARTGVRIVPRGGGGEVFAAALGTNRIDVDIHGSANGAAGNFDAADNQECDLHRGAY
jgi:hypothetical protein